MTDAGDGWWFNTSTRVAIVDDTLSIIINEYETEDIPDLYGVLVM